MSITRWDPFGDMVSLRDAMERLFAESVVRPRGGGSGGGSSARSLAVDVHEQGDDFVVSAPIPGIKPEDVDITVRGDMLRIRGERKAQQSQGGENKRYLVREQSYGSFERVIQLPSSVKADGAQADFNNGVLTITLPKSEESRERRIPVKSGQQSSKTQEVPIDAKSSDGSSKGAASGGQQPMSSQKSGSGSGHHAGDESSAQNKTNGTKAMAGSASGSKPSS